MVGKISHVAAVLFLICGMLFNGKINGKSAPQYYRRRHHHHCLSVGINEHPRETQPFVFITSV